MENEPEVIRDQLQGTRTALTEKLEALEQTVARTVENTTRPVVETVQTVTEATKETVGAVKDTVQQLRDTVTGGVEKTVETVKQTFNLSRQVQCHPWGMMLGSAAAGFLLGRLLPPASEIRESFGTSMGSRMASSQAEPGRAALASEPRGNGHRRGAEREAREPESAGESWLSGLWDTYHDEVEKLKGMGIAAVMGVVRDLVKQSVQGEVGERLGEWVNDLTQKMGGKPFSGPVLATERNEPDATSSAYAPSRGAQSRVGREDLGPLPGR
jgi:ElaB/YqjD/DUF883 family membrane-anchored ribosome-binding protein